MANPLTKESSALEKASKRAAEELKGFQKAFKELEQIRKHRREQSGESVPRKKRVGT